jgi:type I restriction enzyme R subunit
MERLEYVRKEIRDLVQFILGTDNRTFTINIEDIVNAQDGVPGIMPTMTYKQRVIDYLAKNRNLPVLQKIFNIQPLESKDIDELERILWQELGTKEEYDRYVERGKMICGDSVAAFIRSQIGVDRIIAVEKFSKFLSGANLNSMQEEYLKTIITYVCENGDITRDTLIDADSPFCEFDWIAVFQSAAMYVGQYVDNIHSVIAPIRISA